MAESGTKSGAVSAADGHRGASAAAATAQTPWRRRRHGVWRKGSAAAVRSSADGKSRDQSFPGPSPPSQSKKEGMVAIASRLQARSFDPSVVS